MSRTKAGQLREIITDNLGGLRVQLQWWLGLRRLHIELWAYVWLIAYRVCCTWIQAKHRFYQLCNLHRLWLLLQNCLPDRLLLNQICECLAAVCP